MSISSSAWAGLSMQCGECGGISVVSPAKRRVGLNAPDRKECWKCHASGSTMLTARVDILEYMPGERHGDLMALFECSWYFDPALRGIHYRSMERTGIILWCTIITHPRKAPSNTENWYLPRRSIPSTWKSVVSICCEIPILAFWAAK
jgi:hypothetical protein